MYILINSCKGRRANITDEHKAGGRIAVVVGCIGLNIQQAGRQAGKKPKNRAQKSKMHTPHPKYKPFSLSKVFRPMGVLPNTPTYLKKIFIFVSCQEKRK